LGGPVLYGGWGKALKREIAERDGSQGVRKHAASLSGRRVSIGVGVRAVSGANSWTNVGRACEGQGFGH